MTTLAIDGGEPVRRAPWPSWPPPTSDAQRTLLAEVVDSGRWGATSGPLCERLAAEFAERHGARHGIVLTNGTLALFVALRAAGVRPGDEVVVPAYTFVACATAVLLLGAVPVVADVDAVHLHLTADTVRPALTARTRAVMPVHLAGSPAPLTDLLALAAEHGLAVVEDSAQAHGASYRGRPVGAHGTAGTFSFQSSKAMTAGEGGLIVTDDDDLAACAWSACNVGRVRDGAWYHHADVGWNLRMTELQAALLLPWLDRLDDEVAARDAFARRVADGLAATDRPVEVVPQPPGTTADSRHLLMLRATTPVDRDWVSRALAAEGVPVDDGYPPLGGLEPLRARARALPAPGAEAAAASVFWLRQPQLMAGPDGADDVVAAARRVFGDDRAVPGR
ncbi:DegT/DnrJ/EryC1/StrS family aminotransferase [Jiangella ureilytica]|uniref:DegT/DnrJ/EryC1/StrS family aminotransferase n=1 Tax=Jiangella ureilytica TaxID=2530374 RepID=A0A4R4RM91_9ACTN|nr:DegT/DnrJ/EryC1/StrS family aminotransferase [Jiangella ureilytica]TDC50179.1 DegT/DnrJ/EryC1/StrS family aminotransferase [Jiangella ureilytica]